MKFISLTLVVLSMAISQPLWSQDKLYRWKDDDGKVHMGHNIPPRFTHLGYEVVTADGTVIETVNRQATPEELADKQSKASIEAVLAEEKRRREEEEERLMRTYSTIEDIEAAKKRGLRELEIRISILKSNVRSLKRQVENNQARAADTERSGGTVSVEVLAAINDLQDEITETERSVADREIEMEQVSQEYDRDIALFKTLLDEVEMRRSFSSK